MTTLKIVNLFTFLPNSKENTLSTHFKRFRINLYMIVRVKVILMKKTAKTLIESLQSKMTILTKKLLIQIVNQAIASTLRKRSVKRTSRLAKNSNF